MEHADATTHTLNKNMFELFLKDEFLPIYTHGSYTRMFKDTSMAMDLSPTKKKVD